MGQTQNNWARKTVLFLVSQCITLFGSMIVQMSIIWYVTLKTSSGGWVAAFTICSYLPQFLISFFAGVWADRYSRKKLIILSDVLIAIATLIMFYVMPMVSSDFVLFGENQGLDEAWQTVSNCTETDKLFLMLRLLAYFTKTKKLTFSLKEDQLEEDKEILKLVNRLQGYGEE